MFTVGQSPPISRANERQQRIQQPWIQEVAGNLASGDLPTKLRKSENGGEEGDNKKPLSSENTDGLYFSYTGDSNSLQLLHSLLLMGHPPQSFARFCDSRISSYSKFIRTKFYQKKLLRNVRLSYTKNLSRLLV